MKKNNKGYLRDRYGKVYLYYSYKHQEFYKSLNISVKEKGTPDNLKFITDQEIRLIQIVKKYRDKYFDKPPVEYVKHEFEKETTYKGLELNKQFELFYDYKKSELRRKESWKVYQNLQSSLKDYETHINRTIILQDINKDFFDKYQTFLTEPREEGKGGLVSSTITKRMVSFKEFLRWCEEKEIYQFDPSVYKSKIPSKPQHKTIETFTLDEIQLLINKELKGMEDKVRWVMVFLTLTGLRYSDMIELTPNHIKNKKGDILLPPYEGGVIDMFSKKTGTRFIVPLSPITKDILIRFQGVVPPDKVLPNYKIQVFNRVIQDILKEIPQFQKIVRVFRETYGKNQPLRVDDDKKRYELISSHTGRRTFITLLLGSGLPMVKIMEMTGHKKIDVFLGYNKPFTDIKPDMLNFLQE